MNAPLRWHPSGRRLRIVMAMLAAGFSLALGSSGAWAVQYCRDGNPRIAPDSRYVIAERVTGQLIVTDLATGLVWKRCSEGQSGASCAGDHVDYSWQAALALAEATVYAGFDDWRLPNAEELFSLIETGCDNPNINETAFPATVPNWYWSSTPSTSNAAFAWRQSFGSGTTSFSSKLWESRVRLVRGGRPFASFSPADVFRDGFESAPSAAAQTSLSPADNN